MDSNLKLPQTPYSTRVAFIAGAGTLGSNIAQKLLKQNYKVCLVSKSNNQNKNNGCLNLKADLYDFLQLQNSIQQCENQLGGITVAICCAGEFPSEQGKGLSSPIKTTDLFCPKPICGIELNFARTIAPILRTKREGAMVFFSSSITLSCVDSPGFSEFLAWGNALTGMCEGLTSELRAAGVRVSLLFLGLIAGSKFSRATKNLLGDKAINPILLKDESKWVLPSDVANSVNFITDPKLLNGCMWEMELNPQPMLDKNGVFTDSKRVEEMISKLNEPTFIDNKVALITGSGKGIGKGIALELCRAGFNIAAMTRTSKDLDVLKEECLRINPKCDFLSLPLDVTDQAALENGIHKIIEHFGTITIVVSNAGTNRRRVAALADMKTWQDLMNVDLLAAMNLTRLTLPYLIRHAKMSKFSEKPILSFVSTRYAHAKGSRMPGISPYITAKAGTNAFAKVVLEEVRDFGVSVLAFNPGTVATDLGLKPNAAAKDGELMDRDYFLQPADCGKCIVFASQSVSKNCCINNMWLETLYHIYPAIRKSQGNFIAGRL